ncbi:hypothetical protein [Pimelobacter simplex]|uniref:hypothetical protein n=1 Tax=Nocardioides simplex TaxID=2045 RepID=UPI00214FE157|nr:hypothetical protein [Pimelobacter simplex]UUW91887.1 hypothetical protein M0M43_10505 [Pimelobacter simplex]
MKRLGQTLLCVLGVGLIGGTVWIVVEGSREPSTSLSIFIALTTAFAAPLGLAALGAAWKLSHGPDWRLLRTEAEARQRAADALADAETAETIRAELQSYVELRARAVDLQRRRTELQSDAQRLVAAKEELNAQEAQLRQAKSKLDPETVSGQVRWGGVRG